MAFLKSEARPNHRRFADRLIKLDDVTYQGIPKTFYGVLVGIAGEVMAPSQSQRANVELVLAPTQGLNPDLVKLVVKTRTKQGVAKGTELLLDYGDAFDVTLPVLASGAQGKMLGPMDQYMKKVSRDAEQAPQGPQGPPAKDVHGIGARAEEESQEPEAKRQRTEEAAGDPSTAAGQPMDVDTHVDDTSEKPTASPFTDMEKFGEGDRLEC